MPKQRILPHIILGIMGASGQMVTGKQITDYVQRDLGEFWQVAHSPSLSRIKTYDQGRIDYLSCSTWK
ncbi:PadR family transcriptional regulator [Streptococcus suis]|nr:PadR family transcriptional regulator [Streptococcus suis]